MKTKSEPKFLFALCFIAYAAVYVGRKNFSACMSGMIVDGFITKTQGGTAGTAFLAVYACGQLLNGLIGDKISPKYMIPIGLSGAAVMNFLMCVNPIPSLVPVIWGINGYFCSMLWAPVIRCISEWLSDEQRADAGVNISVTLPVGSILSYLICAAMLKWSSWRAAFAVCAAVLICAALIYLLGVASIRDFIEAAEKRNAALRREVKEKAENGGNKNEYSLIYLIIMTGLTFAVGAILFNGILKDGLDLWVPTLISEYFGMSVSFASLLTGVLPIVNLAGVIMSCKINDRFFDNEIATTGFMFAVSAVSFIPLVILTKLFGGGSNPVVAIIAVLLISVTSASMLGANTMLLTFIPFHFSRVGRSSGVTGFLNACSYAAASLSGVTIGLVSTHFGWNATVICFGICAAAGFAVCAVGSGFWKRGREKLK